jgi:preprotein translocase subunit SecA
MAAVPVPEPEEQQWRDGLDRAQERQVEPYLPVLDMIHQQEPALSRISDDRLRFTAMRLRQLALAGTSLDGLLPACFGLVREAAFRVLRERPYDVQMIAGIGLHEGKLIEMQTGEGKTLAAVAPVVLNALTGRGVHVLTFNDYLARRDAGWMGPVYRLLGLQVAHVQEGMSVKERQQAYAVDVTYLTVKEAGFDLLRDNLCLDHEDQVHRPFHLALVDEADSILIDEARIPLVIAGNLDEPEFDLVRLAAVARLFEPGKDYDTDEYDRNIFLTDRGVQRSENLLRCDNLFAAENVRLQAELRNALHAQHLLRRDVDYIVRDGQIKLVDEMTGRIAENRHWPDGLQAAIEAKEGLLLQPEGKLLGSITIQHFLQRYPRLCGMTATASSAALELADVYKLSVMPVPTHRTCARIDCSDTVFTDKEAKQQALLEEIATVHASGRPILVGTVSVEESDQLAAALRQSGVDCRVLNAKNDAEEAEIVAEAGAVGAVTISTNMAGRGTDIRLGGSGEGDCQRVKELGGLYVIGTNRHESRRIDDQLRGRAGRQGDPGSSRFFISLEDDLVQRFGGTRLMSKRSLLGRSANAVDQPLVRKEIEHTQRIVEGQGCDIRKRLMRYAHIIERQRCDLQQWRQAVLEGDGGESLVAERCWERWSRLCSDYGEAHLRDIEQRLTVLIIDRCWSEHLTEMQVVRDEIHLVKLDGRDPLTEFFRTAGAAYEQLVEQIEETVAETFELLEITAEGADWEAAGLRGPSSTWTYLVHDNLYGSNIFQSMAHRPSVGIIGAMMWAPLLFAWSLFLKWRQWRNDRRSA